MERTSQTAVRATGGENDAYLRSAVTIHSRGLSGGAKPAKTRKSNAADVCGAGQQHVTQSVN